MSGKMALLLFSLCVLCVVCVGQEYTEGTAEVATYSWTSPPAHQGYRPFLPSFIFNQPAWLRFWKLKLMKANEFHKWMSVVVPPLSLVLNLCTLLVFLQKSRRKQNVSMVMTALAVADIFAMTLQWSLLVGKYGDFYLHNVPILCDIVYYLTYAGRTCSSWFVLVFTMERFVAVRFPLMRASLLTRTRMHIILLTVTVGCLVSQVYYFVFFDTAETWDGSVRCGIGGYTVSYFATVKFIAREVIGFIIPSLMTAFLNMWIIVLLQKWAEKMAGLSGSGDKKKEAANRSLTIMLVTVSTFSIVSYGPYACLQVYTMGQDEQLNISPQTYIMMVLDSYLQPISWLNHTINFILYCLGGRQFRDEFIHIITCGRGKAHITSTCNTYNQSAWGMYVQPYYSMCMTSSLHTPTHRGMGYSLMKHRHLHLPARVMLN